jgi:hypothetical protein
MIVKLRRVLIAAQYHADPTADAAWPVWARGRGHALAGVGLFVPKADFACCPVSVCPPAAPRPEVEGARRAGPRL